MRQLAVEFKQRYKLSASVLWAVSALILVASICAGGVTWQTYQELRQQESRLQAERIRKAEADAGARSAGELKVQPPYMQDAVRLARIASFDVGRVLRDLESVHVPGVRLQSIDINAVERTARIELDTPGSGLSLRYVDALNAQDAGRWQLIQLSAAGSPPRARVVIEARWQAGM